MWLARVCCLGAWLLVLSRCGGGGSAVGPAPTPSPMPDRPWSLSVCDAVAGSDAVSISVDGGASLLGNPDSPFPTSSVFAFGLVATTRVDTLVLAVDNRIMISEDAGCRWRLLATLATPHIVRLTAGGSDRVYAYTDAETAIHRVELEGAVTTLVAPAVPGALAAFTDRPGVLRLVGRSQGHLFHSDDGGESWSAIGTSPAADLNLSFYFAAFAAGDPDHLVMGTTRLEGSGNNAGVWTSFDGGTTWTQATGFPGRANGFTGTISPANPETVWVLALDVDNSELDRRGIYRATDGGRSFTRVVTASSDIVLTNGTAPFAGPEPNVVYFSVTDPAQVIERMTHLYRYDDGSGTLISNDFSWREVGEIWAMAFNPDHPENLFATKTYQLIQ